MVTTSQTSLESTSLVITGMYRVMMMTSYVAGIDVFVCRVSPSGTFDILSENFAYDIVYASVIAATVGLVVAYVMVKRSGK